MNPPETLEAPSSTPSSKVIVNDLSIEMATANGTGSQSANNIFAKTLFRMGIPVGAKNLFPSNIQGLPTWFTLRVSGKGYTARKRELDILIGMNQETWVEDVAKLRQGAVVIYNSSDLSDEVFKDRSDLIVYPVPITELVRDNIKAPKLRRMLANVVYVGAAAELLGMDQEVLKQVIADNFASKPKAVAVNVQAAELGIQYVKDNLKKNDPYRVESMRENNGKILIDGNAMGALGSLMGGCTVLCWYPITPSSSLPEALIEQFRRFRVDPATNTQRYADVQCEDELASIGAVLGAGWAGARSCTSTSGPGVSLMAEFIGFGYYAEIPGVIFDIQRVGPSTGLPTRTSQGDILSAAYCSHGDTQNICLLPGGPEECYEFGRISFDFADRYQTPVFVLSDLDLGMNFWISEKPEYPQAGFDRGKVLSSEQLKKLEKFERYRDVDGDGIPYRTLPGNEDLKASYFTRGSGHDEAARYSEDGDVFRRNLARIRKKIDGSRSKLPQPEVDLTAGASVGLIAFGSTNAAIQETRDLLERSEIKTSYLRLRALPLALEPLRKFIADHDRVYVIEQNRDAQMMTVIRSEITEGQLTDRLRSVCHYTGIPIDAVTVSEAILAQEPK